MCLYDLPGGRLRSDSIAHRACNNNVAFSPVESILAISAEGGVELWDTGTSQEVGYLERLGAVTTVRWSFPRTGGSSLRSRPSSGSCTFGTFTNARNSLRCPFRNEAFFWR